jgi:hypothetical protein
MTVDPDYEELERQYALPWPPRREEKPPGRALLVLILLAFALVLEEVPRRLWEEASAVVVALLVPDFGWCRCCETYHDLDVPCRRYLEEQGAGVIFTDDFTIGEGGR